MSLVEQYRPRTLRDVVGQDSALGKIEALRQRGLVGRALLITGSSGTGKTTIARILVQEVSDEFARIEIDAQDVTLELLRDIERKIGSRPLGGKSWAVIVNEAHGLRAPIVSRLLTLLETEGAKRALWILTTTETGFDRFEAKSEAPALISRCARIELSATAGLPALATLAKQIAEREGIGGASLAEYRALVLDCGGNFRAVLQRIDAGEMAHAPVSTGRRAARAGIGIGSRVASLGYRVLLAGFRGLWRVAYWLATRRRSGQLAGA